MYTTCRPIYSRVVQSQKIQPATKLLSKLDRILTGHQDSIAGTVSNKFVAIKWLLKILPHHKQVAPLWPCEILMSKYKYSQLSAARCLRWGGIVSDKLNANLLLSVPVKEFWKSVNVWYSYEVMELHGPYFMHHTVLFNVSVILHFGAFYKRQSREAWLKLASSLCGYYIVSCEIAQCPVKPATLVGPIQYWTKEKFPICPRWHVTRRRLLLFRLCADCRTR